MKVELIVNINKFWLKKKIVRFFSITIPAFSFIFLQIFHIIIIKFFNSTLCISFRIYLKKKITHSKAKYRLSNSVIILETDNRLKKACQWFGLTRAI